jgi:hypothetical protein
MGMITTTMFKLMRLMQIGTWLLSGTSAQDNYFICLRDQLAEALLFGDDNHKRRTMRSAFCSRDQPAEARNAITCDDKNE